ncbi:hypothetical protein LINGRAHAP2_LOCUS25416 [Linum grandiflorum]
MRVSVCTRYSDKREGKAEVLKERVEFHEENKMVKLNGLEEDAMKIYKVYNPIFRAKLAIQYEKLDPTPEFPGFHDQPYRGD